MADILKQALGGILGGKVLDIATGDGGFIKTLVDNLNSYQEIIGIDFYQYPEEARAIFQVENVWFVQMDALQLGFNDGCVDTVCISSSLHHLGNIPKCLGEMTWLDSLGLLIHTKIFSAPKVWIQ